MTCCNTTLVLYVHPFSVFFFLYGSMGNWWSCPTLWERQCTPWKSIPGTHTNMNGPSYTNKFLSHYSDNVESPIDYWLLHTDMYVKVLWKETQRKPMRTRNTTQKHPSLWGNPTTFMLWNDSSNHCSNKPTHPVCVLSKLLIISWTDLMKLLESYQRMYIYNLFTFGVNPVQMVTQFSWSC